MTGLITVKNLGPSARNIWSFKTDGLLAVVYQDRFHCTSNRGMMKYLAKSYCALAFWCNCMCILTDEVKPITAATFLQLSMFIIWQEFNMFKVLLNAQMY